MHFFPPISYRVSKTNEIKWLNSSLETYPRASKIRPQRDCDVAAVISYSIFNIIHRRQRSTLTTVHGVSTCTNGMRGCIIIIWRFLTFISNKFVFFISKRSFLRWPVVVGFLWSKTGKMKCHETTETRKLRSCWGSGRIHSVLFLFLNILIRTSKLPLLVLR